MQPDLVSDLLVVKLACGKGLEVDGLWGPLQPKPDYDSMLIDDKNKEKTSCSLQKMWKINL